MIKVKFKKPYKGILSGNKLIKNGAELEIDLEAISPIERVGAEAELRAMDTAGALDILDGYEYE